MLNTLIENGFLQALVASIAGCTLNYIIKVKDDKKPKLVYYLLDIIAALIIAYYAFWEMTEVLGIIRINATLICVLLGAIGTRLIQALCEYILAHYEDIINILLRKK